MRFLYLLGVFSFGATTLLSGSQSPFGAVQSDRAAKPAGKSAVEYLFPEQVTIAADKASPVDLHFRVGDGLHINSHKPHTEDLIPTTLKVPEESGVRLMDAKFPEGKDFAFAVDPKEKLSVYTGNFTIRTELMAAPGEHLVEGSLRYQACNSEQCLPPRTIPVVVDVIAK